MRIVAHCCLLFGLLGALASCKKGKVDVVPSISLTRAEPNVVNIGNGGEDTVVLAFHFIDGDGDIPVAGAVTLLDLRDSGVYKTYKLEFPEIPAFAKDPVTGQVEGDCALLLDAAQYLLPRTDSLHTTLGDTLTFRFHIQDAAGHQSNELSFGPVYIKP